jgi:hypothetical protein
MKVGKRVKDTIPDLVELTSGTCAEYKSKLRILKDAREGTLLGFAKADIAWQLDWVKEVISENHISTPKQK